MRNVVIVAERGPRPRLERSADSLRARCPILVPPEKAVQHVRTIGKDVAHVVKNREAHIVLDERQCWRRKTQLQVIQEQGRASGGELGDWIARAGLVQSEAAVRVTASHEQALRERNKREARRGRLARQGNYSVPECVFDSDSR